MGHYKLFLVLPYYFPAIFTLPLTEQVVLMPYLFFKMVGGFRRKHAVVAFGAGCGI